MITTGNPLIGRTISSPYHAYEVLQEIGGGSQGDCYIAIQKSTNARVVLKLFHWGMINDQTWRRIRFLTDLRLFEITPSLVAPIDMIDLPDQNLLGYVMFFIPFAKSLSEQLSEPLSLLESIEMAIQLAHSGCLLHENGISHGDYHLDNALITEVNGIRQLRLIDLDNFWATGQPEPPCLGERDHYAPELRSAHVKHPNIQSDLFALSVMMHALLLRKDPYEAWADTVDAGNALRAQGGWLYDPAILDPAKEPQEGFPARILNAELCSLFRRGLSADPGIRPSALAWRGALLKALHQVVVCEHCGSQLISDSSTAAKGCPMCEQSFRVLALSGAFGTISLEKSVTIVGRVDLGGNQSVSTRHAAIHRVGPEYRIEDLGSLNGIWRLTPSNGWVRLQTGPFINQKPLIQAGDRLRFGGVDVVVETKLVTN
jgi:serine/threonine protein kinase